MNTELQTTEQQLPVVPTDVSTGALQSALAGDLSRLNESDRLKFYSALCGYVGLNPLSKPFDWLTFQGKLTLYANKGCAEQLRKIHKVNVEIIERRHENGIYLVRGRLTDGDGRIDESIAVLPLPENASAADRAMAMMKCETKFKRRGTFSICGLSLLVKRDEDIDAPPRNRVHDVTGGPTAADRASALNAEIVDVTDEREVALTAIQDAIKAQIPGTDQESQKSKSGLIHIGFGVRSWAIVEAMPVEKLKEGLAKLSEYLTKVAEVDAEVSAEAKPEPAKPETRKLVTKPEPSKPVTPPADDAPPWETEPAKPAVPTLDDDTVAKLEVAIGEHGPAAASWLLKQGWLKPGQGLQHLDAKRAGQILANPAGFLRAVTPANK